MNTHFQIHPQITLDITKEDIQKVLAAAMNGSHPWWRLSLVNDFDIVAITPGRATDILVSGQQILFDVKGTGEVKRLWLNLLLDGIKKHLEDGGYVLITDSTWDMSSMTEDDADCIMQFALLGSIKYDANEKSFEEV